MAKPTQPHPPHLTRKHLVGLERERYVNRLLLIGTIVVVGLVILLVSWSFILEAFVQPGQTVATVEDTLIKGEEFIARTKLYRAQLVSNYLAIYGEYGYMVSLFGSDPTSKAQIDEQYYYQLYKGKYFHFAHAYITGHSQ